MLDLTSGPPTVDADHEDPTSHLTDTTKFPLAGGRIVRNVVEGVTIHICSDVYPISTKAAIARWHADHALSKIVFAFEPEEVNPIHSLNWCNEVQTNVRYGIASVVVIKETKRDQCDNAACIDRVDTPPDKDWDTYRGQLAIYIADSVTRGSSTVVLKDGDLRVTRSITHELGHVFGLGNWKCGNASQVSSMPRIYTSDLTIMGPSNGSCSASIPVFRDKGDFQSSYVPAAPTALGHLSRSPSPNTAIVWWDAYGVHVEKAFAIERENKHGDWEVVATHEPLPLPETEPVLDPSQPDRALQPADQIVTGQDSGWQTYRVVALTGAPLQNTVATFGEIRIFVEPAPPPFLICYAPGPDPRSTDPGEPPTSDCTLSAPSNLTVSSVSGASATLSWADVPAATGYKVRLDGIAYTTETLGDVNSYTFTGLTAGTAHVLEVASSTADGDSEFASLTLLVPPTILATSTTSSSITLNWGKVTGATGYDLKQFAFGGNCDGPGVNGHTSLLNFTFTQGLTASTNYIVCAQARNLQGTSAWASTPARTLAAPVQPPTDPPTITYTTLSFEVGLSPNITWPGHTVGIASALAIRPVDRAYWWNSDTQAWSIYVVAGPTFLQMFTQLRTGENYIFNATEAFPWRIRNASSSARAATGDEATSDADTGSYDRSSGWWSIVTCDSGIAPIEFGGVTSEQEATSNAQWFVASEIGCNGHGSFVLEFVQ